MWWPRYHFWHVVSSIGRPWHGELPLQLDIVGMRRSAGVKAKAQPGHVSGKELSSPLLDHLEYLKLDDLVHVPSFEGPFTTSEVAGLGFEGIASSSKHITKGSLTS